MESNSWGFLLVLFFFHFPWKVASWATFIVAGGNPWPPPLNDSPTFWLEPPLVCHCKEYPGGAMEYYIIDSVHLGSKEIFRVRAGRWRVCILRCGSRGKDAGGVRTLPPHPEMMTCSFLIQLVFCKKNFVVYWC